MQFKVVAAAALSAVLLCACGGGATDTDPNAGRSSADKAQAESLSRPATLMTAAIPPDPPMPTASSVAYGSGIHYYVDEVNGKDSNPGTSSGSAGAWQSMQRLNAQTFGNGDVVYLACGSVFRDMLEPHGSPGSAPVTIASASGCGANRPTIDGGVPIPPQAWSKVAGTSNIYSVALSNVQFAANPSFATDLSGWTATGTGAISRGTQLCGTAMSCMQIVTTGSGAGGAMGTPFALTAGTYSVSFVVWVTAGTTMTPHLRRAGTGEILATGATLSPTSPNTWQHVTMSPTFATTHSYSDVALSFDMTSSGTVRVYGVSITGSVLPSGAPSSWKPYDVTLDGNMLYPAHDGGNESAPASYLQLLSGSTISTLNIAAPVQGGSSQSDLTGMTVLVRTNDWTVESAVVQSSAPVSGGYALTLAPMSTLRYAPPTNAGYILLGKAWMLDTAGEWFYDSSAATLEIWMPDGNAPSQPVYVSTLPVGMHFPNAKVQIDGLRVRRVGIGAMVGSIARNDPNPPTSTGTLNIAIANTAIEDVAGQPFDTTYYSGTYGVDDFMTDGVGIYVNSGSTVAIDSNLLTRIGRDGVNIHTTHTNGAVITNNTLTNIGVVLDSATYAPISIPVNSTAALQAAPGSLVNYNAVQDVAASGIDVVGQTSDFTVSGATVADNHISGWASVLTDNGGIYTAHYSHATIGHNLIESPRRSGTIGSSTNSKAQGIYLDEKATGVTVDTNTVQGADFGIQMHKAFTNVVQNNKFYNNQRGAIFLQDDDGTVRMQNNTISGNVFASPNAIASPLITFGSIPNGSTPTIAASYSGNHYLDRVRNVVASESWVPLGCASTTATHSLLDWRDTGTYTGEFSQHSAGYLVSNVLPLDTTGAGGYLGVQPDSPPQISCPGAACTQYKVTGNGNYSPGRYSLTKDHWYRVSFDVKAHTASCNSPLNLSLSIGWPAQTSDPLVFSPADDGNWHKLHFVFKASAAGTAQIYVFGLTGSASVPQTFASTNWDMAEIAPLSDSDTGMLTNPTPSAVTKHCSDLPWGSCANVYRLSDDTAVTGDFMLAAYESEVFYLRGGTSYDDGDGDGIGLGDTQTSTPAGSEVNSSGVPMQALKP